MYYVFVSSWKDYQIEDVWLSTSDLHFCFSLEMAKPFMTWLEADKAAKQVGAIKYTILKA